MVFLTVFLSIFLFGFLFDFLGLSNYTNSHYAKYLKERLENYLAFAKYPNQLIPKFITPALCARLKIKDFQDTNVHLKMNIGIRPVIRSTNVVEGINNAIEIARRNSGGYFHSERELAVKTKIIFDNLTQGKWRNPIPRFAGNLAQINQLFCERFGEWG
jgi:transposase-like protein